MQSASNITNLNEYEDVVDKVTVIDGNFSTLQSYTALKGTNFGIGPDVFQELTSGTQNTAIGNGAGGGTYGLTTGSRNVMVGYNLGGGCETGSNNTFLGSNTNFEGATYKQVYCIRCRGQNLGWCQVNGNWSNSKSKFDFLATRQQLVKIGEGQQKIKTVLSNQQSLPQHHPCKN